MEVIKRLPDGSFSELVNPFGNETKDEIIARLGKENARLKQEDLNNKEAIAELYMMALGGF